MTGLKVQLALGGDRMEKGAKVEAHLIVGTPGKVVDWLKRRTIDSKNIKVFVLDPVVFAFELRLLVLLVMIG